MCTGAQSSPGQAAPSCEVARIVCSCASLRGQFQGSSFAACYDFSVVKLPKHIAQLDVLRGVAVLVVMLYHSVDLAPALHLSPLFNRGYVGVDLFFVLS